MAQDDNILNDTGTNDDSSNSGDNEKDFNQNPNDQDNPLYDMAKFDRTSDDEDQPFSDPDDVNNRVNPTAQVTDSNVDPHEEYDAGLEAASGVDLPHDSDDDTEPERVA